MSNEDFVPLLFILTGFPHTFSTDLDISRFAFTDTLKGNLEKSSELQIRFELRVSVYIHSIDKNEISQMPNSLRTYMKCF